MQLYSFFNSSTSYRVRIALALKGLPYDYLPVNIRTGEHRAADYVAHVNPSAGVPTLVDGALRLGQSLAIIDYLDARHPQPRLVPADPLRRARVLELASAIACDIHPVNNLRVLRYLQDELKVTPQQKDAWYRHWIDEGLASVERLLARHGHGPGASATHRRWRTWRSCRRSPTRCAWVARSIGSSACWPCMRTRARTPPSPRPRRRASPTTRPDGEPTTQRHVLTGRYRTHAHHRTQSAHRSSTVPARTRPDGQDRRAAQAHR